MHNYNYKIGKLMLVLPCCYWTGIAVSLMVKNEVANRLDLGFEDHVIGVCRKFCNTLL